MKRFLAGVVVGVVIASVPVAFAEDVIHLVVNGKEVVFPEAPPQMINGRVMVPARPLAEALGAKVAWDEATRTVIVEQYEELAPVTPPSPEPPPLVIKRDGAVFVQVNHFRSVLEAHFGSDHVAHSGFKWTVNGTTFTLSYMKEGGFGYLDAKPLIDAGLLTETDFH